MDMNHILNEHFEEPRFDNTIIMGIPYMEMRNVMGEIEAACKDLNRLGIKDFEFVKVSLTNPMDEVQRSIFQPRKMGEKGNRKVLKLDRNGTYMIDFLFRYQGKDLSIANVRVPNVLPGSKFIMWGKNNFIQGVLVDRGVNLSKGELYIRLDNTSFNMVRTTHPYMVNHTLSCDNVITGNPHHTSTKVGKSPDRIAATQNLFLYPLAKYGWDKAVKKMGVDLKLVEADSYEDAYAEWYPQGYTVFGSSGIKTSDGGPKASWNPPKMYILYKGDLNVGSNEYMITSTIVASFYYIADRIPSYLNLEVVNEVEFWYNVLGRFLFFHEGKTGQWYTSEGRNHIENSMDTLIDVRTRRSLNRDGIDVDDTYELMIWLMLNEREVYANIHPSDISRKRVTTVRYLLSYILDNINRLGYKLLGNTDSDGNFKPNVNARRLNEQIRMQLKEGTIRELVKKNHGEVTSIESPSSNMFITNTRTLLDQTKVKGSSKERNHMYNPHNNLHASKMMRCRVDGIDATPSGATQINPLPMDMSADTSMILPDWLRELEDELEGDLNGDF